MDLFILRPGQTIVIRASAVPLFFLAGSQLE